ncbi:MAG: polysaccharide biosynthesis C-terminal domain-containing protein [Crocinitomicaceae bacterium]|nr:polysaccharide biosynthesis C-terminal domain-containing protein [Crocinitomicaceae bacterium]
MQKKFFTNLTLLILLNLLVKPFAIFGIDLTIQNRVGAENYGLYFSLMNLSLLFSILMDIGINNYTTTHVARFPSIASKYIHKLFSLRFLLFGIYALVTFVTGFLLHFTPYELGILSIFIFNQFLITLTAYFRSHFGGLHLFKTDAVISVLDRFLLILIGGYLLLTTTTFKIEWFIWAQTIAYGLTCIVSFLLLSSKIGIPKFKFHPLFSIAILKKSYPYALLILLMMFYSRIDSVILERIHPNGKFEAGVYAQGFRLLDAFFMFGMLFANLLLPLFARLLEQDKKSIQPLLKTARNLLLGGAILVAFCSAFNARYLLELFYNENISASIPSFQFLIWGFIGMCMSLIYGTLLTANGSLKILNWISLVGIVVNIIINVVLIPKYGATGAAIAVLFTQSVTALAQMIYCHLKFSFAFPWREFSNYALFVALLLIIPLFTNEGSHQFFVQLASGIVGLFIFKLIDFKEILRFLKEK